MNNTFNPPYEITNKMLDQVSFIMENIGKLSDINNLNRLPRLRRVNRIKSIHSSLAIENNTLTLKQVTDVIEGKKVLAPKEDILEVQNAYEAYKKLNEIDPFSVSDLLNIHSIIMKGLVKEAGQFRSGQVGVYNQDGKVVHIAPPAEIVKSQIEELFNWVKESDANMLIKSCVFHYEFEFIHPFNDGNGRTGRLWQTTLLASWKPIFYWIPIESIIKDNQEEYYRAITLSTSQGKSNVFIEFMLDAICTSIVNMQKDVQNHTNHLNNQITQLLTVLESFPQSAVELMEKLNLKSRLGFRKNYLQPAIDAGLVGMTEPDKPTSKNQKYFKL